MNPDRHDPLCIMVRPPGRPWTRLECQCRLIAEVRADERRRACQVRP